MSALIWLPTAAVVAVLMDLWAALLHGRVWHHALWRIHRTHHTRRRGRFETNDLLSTLHAPPAIALVLYGCAGPPGALREIAFGIGIGMSAFGLAYVVVHDGLVHGRLPVRALGRARWLREIARAHRIHHAGVHGGPPYGLFTGPLELARLRRAERRGAASRRRGPSAPPSTDRARA